MPFQPIGISTALAVDGTGQSTPVLFGATQCRVWNEGPNPARVRYGVGSQSINDTDMIVPAGLLEVHTKLNFDTLSAKCKSGETATLHIICGTGD